MKKVFNRSRRSPAAVPMASVAGHDASQYQYDAEVDARGLGRAMRITWISSLAIAALLVWSYFAEVVEVSTGDGHIVPISREQVIQSLEGGILLDLMVREGDIVEPDQVLAQMDLTQTESDVDDGAAGCRALLASVARREAESNGTPLAVPAAVEDSPELAASEARLHHARREGLRQTLAGVQKSLALVR